MLPERRPPPPRTAANDDAADARLLRRIAAGDVHALDTVYRAYHPRLTRFLGQMTRQASLVDEAVNDTLFVVWRSASRFDHRSRVSTWIFGIAYRRALKALQRFDEPQPDATTDTPAESRAEPEAQRGHRELQAALLAALDRLTPEHRAVVALTYFHDMGYAQIADVVGCPVDTVKTRMFHARRRLRTLLPGTREDWL